MILVKLLLTWQRPSPVDLCRSPAGTETVGPDLQFWTPPFPPPLLCFLLLLLLVLHSLLLLFVLLLFILLISCSLLLIVLFLFFFFPSFPSFSCSSSLPPSPFLSNFNSHCLLRSTDDNQECSCLTWGCLWIGGKISPPGIFLFLQPLQRTVGNNSKTNPIWSDFENKQQLVLRQIKKLVWSRVSLRVLAGCSSAETSLSAPSPAYCYTRNSDHFHGDWRWLLVTGRGGAVVGWVRTAEDAGAFWFSLLLSSCFPTQTPWPPPGGPQLLSCSLDTPVSSGGRGLPSDWNSHCFNISFQLSVDSFFSLFRWIIWLQLSQDPHTGSSLSGWKSWVGSFDSLGGEKEKEKEREAKEKKQEIYELQEKRSRKKWRWGEKEEEDEVEDSGKKGWRRRSHSSGMSHFLIDPCGVTDTTSAGVERRRGAVIESSWWQHTHAHAHTLTLVLSKWGEWTHGETGKVTWLELSPGALFISSRVKGQRWW